LSETNETTYTREDAVAAIVAMEAPPALEENVGETNSSEPETTTEETQTDVVSEEEIPGDNEEETTEETVEAEADPVDAPNWWDAEAKGKFAELDPELQAIVRAQEDKREAVTQKAKQEAAEARKVAEVEAQKLASLAERADAVFSKAEEAFKSKWDGMTPDVWAELAATDPETAFQLKLEYEAEQDHLHKVSTARAEAARVAQENHYSEQRTKLLELNPKLASDQAQLQSLGSYIVSSGIPPEAIQSATAVELNIVWKAMQYDNMMNKARQAKENPVPVPKPAPQKSIAVASSRESQLPPQEREVQTIKNRLNQTKSRDDLAALFKTGAFG
jgi:hypothetical protein